MTGRWPTKHVLWGSAALALACSLLVFAGRAQADFFDDVGYTQLVAELDSLGKTIPTGAGVGVNQTEATDGDGDYGPKKNDAAFLNKHFTEMSGATGTSSHATSVARRIYGNDADEPISTARDVTEIDLWDADDFIGSGALRTGTISLPNVERQRVENHSWIANMATDSLSIQALQRLDYAIDRDGFVAVVGVNNKADEPLWALFGQSYNTISVGRTDGNHGHGLTTLDGAGRIKPEIVSPSPYTSFGTARVSSAAAMLLEQAAGTAAETPQAIKAILLAGATKDEFVDRPNPWDRTLRRPLDDVFGAGELNVYRSYHILDAGQQPASDASVVDAIGWDFDQTSGGERKHFFEVPIGYRLNELSAVLTWHRTVSDGGGIGFDPQGDPLANLDLSLFSATEGFATDRLLDASASLVDNVEHIYLNSALGINGALELNDSLGPGRYLLDVTAPVAGVDYALAWFSDLVLVGDMNRDGVIDFDDIDPFVLGLTQPDEYQSEFGILPRLHGDIDGDGDQDFDDVVGFVGLLSGDATAVRSTMALRTIPEPATSSLAVMALLLVLLGGRPRVGRATPA